jgi:hypothetical protein
MKCKNCEKNISICTSVKCDMCRGHFCSWPCYAKHGVKEEEKIVGLP